MIIKTEEIIDYKKIFNNNLNYFKECDYLYGKYKIPYTIVYIESFIEVDFSDKLRYVDRYIKINNKKHIIIFTHTFFKQAYQAILRLERTFIKNNEHIFSIGIDGIKKDSNKSLKINSIDLLENAIKNKNLL